MIEIHELRLSAIGRFVEEQVIDFRKLGNLVQVDGIRSDTGGSSGSGKSTVFNSLDYLFGLNDIPSSVLQSRYTKDAISVTMIGKYIGKDLTISRGKGKLLVELDGEKISGSKLAEEKIDELLGMPRKLFRPLLHKRQKEGGFFLQFTPKEIHEFLMDATGGSELRKKQDLIEDTIKSIENDLVFYTGELNKAKSGLDATQSAFLGLGQAPVSTVDQATVLALKGRWEAANAELAPIKARHTLELQTSDLGKPALRSSVRDETVKLDLQAKLVDLNKEISVILEKHAADTQIERERAAGVALNIQKLKDKLPPLANDEYRADEAKKLAGKIALEIKKIRENTCPTCEQGWTTESARLKESEYLEKLKNYKELISKGDVSKQEYCQIKLLVAELEPSAIENAILVPGWPDLQERKKDLEDQIKAEIQQERDYALAQHRLNQVASDQFYAEQRKLTDRHTAELQQVNGQIDLTRRAFESAAQQLKSYAEAKAKHEFSVNAIDTQYKKYSVEVGSFTKNVVYLKDRLAKAEELKKAIKGYTSCSFDEALEYIGSAATEIIRAIPNMANATIQLQGTKETKDGKVKEEVNAVINMDGELEVPIKSLSGGERSSVDLAVDLAVIDLLENRTNKGINLFILDEPFTGLDTISIEMAIEKLRSLNKRLVIVDHNPEIKQMVESRLVVVRDGQTSKIEQN